MKLAAIQMVSGASVADNLARASALMTQAADQGAELLVLPEYFCLLGQRDTDKLDIQEAPGHGPIQDFLAQAAHKLGVWVVGGTLPLSVAPKVVSQVVTQALGQPTTAPQPGRERVFNASLVYNPQGVCVARYDKIHLFGFDNGQERYDESRALMAGQQPAWVDVPSADGHTWRVGLSVCYDLRFPELYRHYAQLGAHVLLVPSAFTHTTGQAHWEVLLRARAIENLAFVAASAQGGLHDNGRRTWGHSMVVDPWGEVLSEQAQGEAVVMAQLDMASLVQRRAQLPALTHRVL
jgi:nitrilase